MQASMPACLSAAKTVSDILFLTNFQLYTQIIFTPENSKIAAFNFTVRHFRFIYLADLGARHCKGIFGHNSPFRSFL